MNIVFLGPPGSGKGTQAKRLAETQDLIHLSTGDVFREAIASGSDLGNRIKGFVDSGKLVPDELVSEVVFHKLKNNESGKGFLLDGYPRTLDQAKALDQFSEREKVVIDTIFFFEVDSDELVKRLSARRYCKSCREVYNLVSRPPKEQNKCDLNGETLIQRPDDKAEVVQERLRVYHNQTEPLLEYYKPRKEFNEINAAQDIDRVFAEIVSLVQAKPNQVH